MASQDQARASYLRWQEIAITQLGYVINLIMTLSLGALGFALHSKIGGGIRVVGPVWHVALLVLALSILCAVGANFTRALDFRFTRMAARERMKDGGGHDELHDKAEVWGAWTWRLFYVEAVTFAAGIVLLAWCLAPFP